MSAREKAVEAIVAEMRDVNLVLADALTEELYSDAATELPAIAGAMVDRLVALGWSVPREGS